MTDFKFERKLVPIKPGEKQEDYDLEGWRLENDAEFRERIKRAMMRSSQG